MSRKYNLPKYVTPDPDRHGNQRFYFRRTGQKKIRLTETPGTREFDREVDCARAGVPYEPANQKQLPGPKRVNANKGSFRWLCQQYEKRAAGSLNDKLWGRRIRLLNEICDLKHKDKKTKGDLPFAQMKRRHVVRIRDQIREGPAARNEVVKGLSSFFNWANNAGEMEGNPCHGITPLKAGDGFHTWTLEEIQRFAAFYPSGTKERLLLALALFTGLRRQDLPGLGWQHIHDTDDGLRLKVLPKKTRRSTAIWVDIPVHPVLLKELVQVPDGQLSFLLNQNGKPYSVESLGNYMRKICRASGLEGCSLHGLRKAAASIAAENGATDDGLMSAFGWTTKRQTTLYTRAANRSKMANAAVAAIQVDLEKRTKKE